MRSISHCGHMFRITRTSMGIYGTFVIFFCSSMRYPSKMFLHTSPADCIHRNGEDLSLWSADDLEKPSELRLSSAADTNNIPRDDSQHALSLASTTSTLVGSSLSPKSISAGSFPSSLILDGARAIEAICRPFPIAMVGRPERVDFDIYTSAFNLEIRVGPSDASGGGGANADGGNKDGRVTEVYLPFVHFAACPDSTSNGNGNGTGVTSGLIKNQNVSSRSNTPAPLSGNNSTTPLELDVEIQVSTGSTSISGQTLIWTYDIPPTERIITLNVKRRGGPIKREGSAALVAANQQGSWSDVCSSCTIA